METSGEQNRPATIKDIMVGQFKTFGIHISSSCALNAKNGATKFNVFKVSFSFGLVIFHLLIVTFTMEMLTLWFCTLGLCNCFLLLQRLTVINFPRISEEIGFSFFNNAGAFKILRKKLLGF